MVRRGSRASSAIGAAASNPMNARMVKIEAAATPEKPSKSLTLAWLVPKTDRVLLSPALAISHTASAAKTAISKTPRIVPVPALTLMPR